MELERVIPLAKKLSHQFSIPGYDPDDLYQEALIISWLKPQETLGRQRTVIIRKLSRLKKRAKKPVEVTFEEWDHPTVQFSLPVDREAKAYFLLLSKCKGYITDFAGELGISFREAKKIAKNLKNYVEI